MDAVVHLVGIEAVEEALHQLVRGEADIHEDGLGAFIEPLDMLAQERHAALDHAQPLPHAVAQDEARSRRPRPWPRRAE